MDNFDKIIKQKAEQFEVPFNDAHWAEMEGKLNAIRMTKIKNTILGSVSVVALIAASSYFIFSNNETITTTNNTVIVSDNPTEANTNNTEKVKTILNNTSEKVVMAIENQAIENGITVATEEEIKPIAPENTTPTEEVEKTSPTVIATDNLKKVNAEFIVYNNKVCLGEEVSFESSENEYPVSYTWNFGDGTISKEANPTHRYKTSNIYTVSLTLLNRQTGQEFTTIQQDVVNILPTPKTSFSYSETSIKNDDNTLKHPYTTFKVNAPKKQYSYKWNYGNKEVSSSANGKTIYKRAREYTVTLTVKDNLNGCSQTTKEKINIKNSIDLLAPNGFTPNNDGGNETFIPKALLGWDVQFEMTIINKSGKVIYKTSDKNEPWNGKINNTGQVLTEGIYLWQVITYDAEGTSHRHHGKIHLVK